MSELNNNNLNILDLPDEILLIILRKLGKIDVLYSLMYVDHRFYRLALDSLYICDLDMTDMRNINSLYHQMFTIDTQSLSRFSENILPKIQNQVRKLAVEQYSIKQILITNYPQLYSLSIINCQEDLLYQYLTDDTILRQLTKQITHVNIDFQNIIEHSPYTVSNIFTLIVSLFEKLIELNFGDMFLTRQYRTPAFCAPLESCRSSSLVKLKIKVIDFTDLLFLLDGRFESLSTLITTVYYIHDDQSYNILSRKLSKLKCFSLTVKKITESFDSVIVPLLSRMRNLEELQLNLFAIRYHSIYIDGVQLLDGFLIYLTQLNKFTFSIKTRVIRYRDELELQTNEDIQRSFIGRYVQQVASYVQTNSTQTRGKCHIYTVPYEFEYFYELDHSFQVGKFHKVRYLSMDDFIAFEHEFFQLISEEFPFVEFLYISNYIPMKDKQNSFTLIKFSYLTLLDVRWAHPDYAELFLLKKNMYLPCLLNLVIRYKSLIIITKNFTNDPKHFNFDRLISVDICESFVRAKNFHRYFPLY